MTDPQPSETAPWLEFPSGERVPLAELCSIGRMPPSQIVIDNERVSRRHATIRRLPDGAYEIMDMGSSNGTYLNGRRIDRPSPLRDGHLIEIGLQKITFRMPVSEPGNQVTTTADGWLLAVEAALRGARTPIEHFSEKTVESWNERCHRLILKQKGTPVRALKEGLLAYWRSDVERNAVTAVAITLQAMRGLSRETEEFRFAVHYGPMTFRTADGSASKPSGDAVIYTLQLQRLVVMVDASVLISEEAHRRLADTLSMRRLTAVELREKGGNENFYTLAE